MFERIPTQLPDVFVIKPRLFPDVRGFFAETYRANEMRKIGIVEDFVQDNQSRSVRGTLRGMHYQWRNPQAKLCRVIRGEVLDVAVDIRRGSPTFGRYASAVLSAQNMLQIYIPVGFAHGFLVLSDEADFLYRCSDYYDPEGAYGVLWSDTAVGIDWGTKQPVLSEKDAAYPALAHVPEKFLPVYKGQ